MNYIDIVLAILLLTGLVRGFLKGFVFEIAILGCFFLGSYAAFHFAYLLEPHILKLWKVNGRTLVYISSFLMFVIISIGIFFLAKLFTGLINIAALGVFNKILGGL